MKKHIFYLILISAFISIMSKCKEKPVELKVIPLTLERIDYTENQLRTDGYYFHEWESDVLRWKIFIFYRNGIMIYGSNPPLSEIEQIEQKYITGEWYDLIKEDRTSWGVFQIKNDTIKLEYWYPPGAGAMYYQPYIFEGNIINDTTFCLKEQYLIDYAGNKYNLNELDQTFHFKKFSPKPDSTNNFIN